uniref:response regulator n=1 Tax=Roseivirga sp. TaxID=1964215 RepID=UPI004047CE30
MKTPNTKHSLKLLVVDDHPLNLKLLSIFMTKWNFDFDLAENGRTAVDKAKANHYDYILMDVQLPDITGPEAIKEIKNFDEKSQVIYLTGMEMNHDLGKTHGVEYLQKPYNPMALKSMIEKGAEQLAA